jgi:hypothetical protein
MKMDHGDNTQSATMGNPLPGGGRELYHPIKLSSILYMRRYEAIIPRVIALIGEEGLALELEGILRKHEGIARRERKAGRVERCAAEVGRIARGSGEPVERVAARAALARNLSQASVYRMAALLQEQGIDLTPADILREMGRIRQGIY